MPSVIYRNVIHLLKAIRTSYKIPKETMHNLSPLDNDRASNYVSLSPSPPKKKNFPLTNKMKQLQTYKAHRPQNDRCQVVP